MGKRKDSSIQLTHIRIRESGKRSPRPHPAVRLVYRWLCFMCGSFSLNLWFATLFQLGLSTAFLGQSTLLLGLWYFAAFISKKTRRICIPVSLGAVILAAAGMWESVYQGAARIINTASQYIMDYYFVNPGFLPAEADQGAVMATMVLLEAVMMLWLANSVLARKKSGGLLAAAAALLCMGLVVNRFPSPAAVLLWAFSFFAVRALGSSGKKQKALPFMMGPALGTAAFAAAAVLASWFLISPGLNSALTAKYPQLREFQDSLEDRVEGLLGGGGSGSWQKMVQKGVLSNNAPAGDDETALTMTADSPPEDTVYLKGFIGNIYQGTYWEEISEENFQSAAEDQYSYGLNAAQNPDIDWQKIGYSVLQQYLVRGPYEYAAGRGAGETLDFSLSYQNTPEEFVYAPYLSAVDDGNVEYYADVELIRTGKEAVQGKFYPEIPEVSGSTGYASGSYGAENIFYLSYVSQEYLYVPSEGLEQLKSSWASVLEEYQDMTGHYPTLQETTTLIRQMLSECSYSLDLDPVPKGADFVEDFLFRQKKGFCTHFASTSVLLYRLAGYPARYATGYIARPEEFRENENGTYTAEIPGKNAHAWAEVYQDNGAGWIPVEMTPGYDEGRENQEEETTAESVLSPTPEEIPEQENVQGGVNEPEDLQVSVRGVPTVLLRAAAGVCAAAALILILVLRRKIIREIRKRKFNQKNRRKALKDLAREAYKMLSAAGFKTGEGLSDTEYAKKVQEAFPGLAPGSFLWFTEQGERAEYSAEHISEGTKEKCLRIYEELEKEISRGKGRLWKLRWHFIKCY